MAGGVRPVYIRPVGAVPVGGRAGGAGPDRELLPSEDGPEVPCAGDPPQGVLPPIGEGDA